VNECGLNYSLDKYLHSLEYHAILLSYLLDGNYIIASGGQTDAGGLLAASEKPLTLEAPTAGIQRFV